jgi:hypothetical protein
MAVAAAASSYEPQLIVLNCLNWTLGHVFFWSNWGYVADIQLHSDGMERGSDVLHEGFPIQCIRVQGQGLAYCVGFHHFFAYKYMMRDGLRGLPAML